MRSRPGIAMTRASWIELASVLVACVALSALFTYPWVPNRASIPTAYQGADEFYSKVDASMWSYMLAWGARHPLRFYDAPVLLPVKDPLTANDPRLTEGIWSIPLFRLLPPVLAWGFTLWLALALTAAGSYYAGARLTGSRWGGAAVTILFAFGMFRANHVCHIEGIFAPFLALALAAMVRFLESPDRRVMIGFALALSAATIEYSYIAVPLALTLPVAHLWGIRRRGIPWKRGIAPLAVAGVLTAVLLAPVALQYIAFHRANRVQRQLETADWCSAGLFSWITGPSGTILPPFGGARSDFFDAYLFPGFIALVLGLAGLRLLWKKSPEVMLVGILAFVLSFGTMRLLFWQIGLPYVDVPTPYGVLYRLLLPLQAIRSPARLGVLAHLVLAFSGAIVVARMAASSRGRVAAVVLLAVSFLETRAGIHPVEILPQRAGDPAYRWIADQPGQFAVLDAPMGLYKVREQHFQEAQGMLVSLVHGKPTPNGTIAAGFPWHESIAVGTADPGHAEAKRLLRALGIRFVVTRDAATEGRYREAGYRSAYASPAGIHVFEVSSPMSVPASPRVLAKRLAGDPFYSESRARRETTAFQLSAPAEIEAKRGCRFELSLTVHNEGRTAWAGNSQIYGRGSDGDVMIGIRRWRLLGSGAPKVARGPQGEVLSSTASLPANVLPGESVAVLSSGTAPIRPGRYLAELDMGIRGTGWLSPPDRPPATVSVRVN